MRKAAKYTKQDANLVFTLYNTKRKTVVDVTHKQGNDLCSTIGQELDNNLLLLYQTRIQAGKQIQTSFSYTRCSVQNLESYYYYYYYYYYYFKSFFLAPWRFIFMEIHN